VRARAALRYYMKSFALIRVIAETSAPAWPTFALTSPLALRSVGQQAWLAGCTSSRRIPWLTVMHVHQLLVSPGLTVMHVHQLLVSPSRTLRILSA
jgi:hypothetical protein